MWGKHSLAPFPSDAKKGEKATVKRKLKNASNVVKPSFISVYFIAIKESTTERIFVTNVGKPLVTTLNLPYLWWLV